MKHDVKAGIRYVLAYKTVRKIQFKFSYKCSHINVKSHQSRFTECAVVCRLLLRLPGRLMAPLWTHSGLWCPSWTGTVWLWWTGKLWICVWRRCKTSAFPKKHSKTLVPCWHRETCSGKTALIIFGHHDRLSCIAVKYTNIWGTCTTVCLFQGAVKLAHWGCGTFGEAGVFSLCQAD